MLHRMTPQCYTAARHLPFAQASAPASPHGTTLGASRLSTTAHPLLMTWPSKTPSARCQLGAITLPITLHAAAAAPAATSWSPFMPRPAGAIPRAPRSRLSVPPSARAPARPRRAKDRCQGSTTPDGLRSRAARRSRARAHASRRCASRLCASCRTQARARSRGHRSRRDDRSRSQLYSSVDRERSRCSACPARAILNMRPNRRVVLVLFGKYVRACTLYTCVRVLEEVRAIYFLSPRTPQAKAICTLPRSRVELRVLRRAPPNRAQCAQRNPQSVILGRVSGVGTQPLTSTRPDRS